MQVVDKYVASEMGQQQYLCGLTSVVGFCKGYLHQAHHVMPRFPCHAAIYSIYRIFSPIMFHP